MNEIFFKQHYNELLKQRRQLLLFAGASLLLIIVLAFTNLYQVFVTRVIVVPPQLNKAFFVVGNKLSASGLEQHGAYFAHLYLDVTPETINLQHKLLLQNVAPKAQVALKEELTKIATTLKKLGVSSRFAVQSLQANVKRQEILITGKLCFFQGPTEGITEEKTFLFKFSNQYGKPFVQQISEKLHAQ
jgi:conjugal transfer pilus assembly protein TraE